MIKEKYKKFKNKEKFKNEKNLKNIEFYFI